MTISSIYTQISQISLLNRSYTQLIVQFRPTAKIPDVICILTIRKNYKVLLKGFDPVMTI